MADQMELTAGRLGLSSAQVLERIERGQTNAAPERTSRTLAEILRANLLTRFNVIMAILLAAILSIGDVQDAIFGVVPGVNALIGIAQELRAKRILDRLALLSAPRARVVRDGVVRAVAVDDVVLDDLLEVNSGDQVVADGVVRDSTGMQVDESLITGEADAVDKQPGDRVLSGSFVVAGAGRFQATGVGAAAYARRVASEARRFTPVRSDLRDGINRILFFATWALVPAAILLLVSQLHVDVSARDAVAGVVAGLVGMVPQGLVLLTSITFAVAAVTLAQRRALVQELPAVEGLARVDVVCFDKTGTLTDGTIRYTGIERLVDDATVEQALAALAAGPGGNATMSAIGGAFPRDPAWQRTAEVPFSSARKWSGATYAGQGTWVLGAPEMLMAEGADDVAMARANHLSATGRRVLLLGRTPSALDGNTLPADIRPVALVLFEEHLRDDAADTLAYFAAQGVAAKMISGDSPRTLGVVARRVGIPGADQAIDARELGEDLDGLASALEEHAVFGRVSPRQKQAMVRALQARGHTVAMTGDGVNDVLALKSADIGIAMGSGAPATRAVAQLVLLDGRFATLPGVVAEGRRVTANIERVANLFVTKTVWATLLALAIGFARWPYPFLPRHLSIIDSLTIGIPGFFLALAPNSRRYVPGFVDRVLRFTIPSGSLVALATFLAFAVAGAADVSLAQQRTAATIVALAMSLAVLVLLALPLTPGRALLIATVAAVFGGLFPLQAIRRFLDLEVPSAVLAPILVIAIAGVTVLVGGWMVVRRRRASEGAPAIRPRTRR